jgi:hypothetical protein
LAWLLSQARGKTQRAYDNNAGRGRLFRRGNPKTQMWSVR